MGQKKEAALLEAVRRKDAEAFIQILQYEPAAIHAEEDGVPAALLAARTGDMRMISYVAEYSMASLNTVDREKRTILHHSVMSGSVEAVRYLTERGGMSPTDGDRYCETPFDLAVRLGFGEIADYFSKRLCCSYGEMYHNPVLSGAFADPSVVRVGEDYYMVNSSFIYFPAIPISHSRDLIHWEIIGHAITDPKWAELEGLEGGRGYWAPDISWHKGRFYITATYRFNDAHPVNDTHTVNDAHAPTVPHMVYRRQMVTSSEKPEGPYCEPAWFDVDGIDPSLFTDDDGRRYMLLNRGAKIFEISEDGKRQLSEPVLLYYGDQKRAPEGPHLLKKDGWYYLFLAEGGTGMGHRITAARSKSLFGVYEPCPYNPILRQWNEDAPIQRAGHGKPVQTQNGQWYMVYLCGRPVEGKYSILGRETALDPITWTEDGWPLVNHLDGPSVLQKKPDLPEYMAREQGLDQFDKNELGKQWMTPRPPEAGSVRVAEGCLWLTGSRADLNDTACRSVVVRRQQHFCFSARTMLILEEGLTGKRGLTEGTSEELSFNGLLKGQEAGLTCYYDENTYLKFGLCSREGNLILRLAEWIDDRETRSWQSLPLEIAREPRQGEKTWQIELGVETRWLERRFLYRTAGAREWTEAAAFSDVTCLCDEGLKKGKRFTGAMVGMYAVSGENGVLTAKFAYFDYRELDTKRIS